MAVPTETSQDTYVGNGAATDFPITFAFLETSEVVVKVTPAGGVESILIEGTDYDVNVVAPQVEFNVAPAINAAIVIERTVPFTQPTAFRTEGEFSPATHENQFDEVVFQTQQLDRRLKAVETAGGPGSVAAGSGLTMAGATLHVGAGPGIVVNPDTVEIDFGLGASANKVTSDNAGAASTGGLNEAMRIDATLRALTANPSPLVVGAATAKGVSNALANADHGHQVTKGAPVQLDSGVSASGASGNFSDADHKHEIRSGAGVEITDGANTPGAGPGFALEGHSHSHGNRGNGALHAVATAAVAGFMPAAMFKLLNAALAALSHVHAYQAAAQTHATGAGANIIFGTEDYDTNGEYDPATGIFTAKDAGYIHVAIDYSLAAAAWVATNTVTLQLIRNSAGDIVEATATDVVDANVNEAIQLHVCKVVKVAIGDTIRAFLSHNQGGPVNSGGTRAVCSMTLHRVL